ncbi:hypothetical protein HNO92_003179 [Chromobacterium alkanivorans]|nr:hypothetical protein [Chromobacterium alkanivorans]MCS3820090.1 hypothetical protein [Chromobacterium alkanivorans]MCS3874847.1 hypothetical protein [Chromobacterium alkanivorans]
MQLKPAAPRSYALQYRESDYDFIVRLLHEEGYVWRFRHLEANGPRVELLVFDNAHALLASPLLVARRNAQCRFANHVLRVGYQSPPRRPAEVVPLAQCAEALGIAHPGKSNVRHSPLDAGYFAGVQTERVSEVQEPFCHLSSSVPANH